MSTRRQKTIVWTIGLFMASVAFAGGFWGGASTPSGALTIPNGQGTAIPITFTSASGAYERHPWRMSINDTPTGTISTDHVFSFYFGKQWINNTWVKDGANGTDNDKVKSAVNMNFESRYLNAGDPNTLKGYFEWNMNIDPNEDANFTGDRRIWEYFYDLDNKHTGLTVGAIADAASPVYTMGSSLGHHMFTFPTVAAGGHGALFRVGTGSAAVSSNLRGIYLGAGVPYESTYPYIVFDTYYVTNEGDLNIEPGLSGVSGTVADIWLSKNRPGDVRIPATGTLTISSGTSGAMAITGIFTGSGTIDFASALTQQCSADVTITVNGSAVGDAVSCGIPALPASSQVTCWVSGTNTVSFRHCCNGTAATCDPLTATFKAVVIK